MSISVVQLGTPRLEGEGVGIGTVRRPARRAPTKEEFSAATTMTSGCRSWRRVRACVLSAKPPSFTDADWNRFVRALLKGDEGT